jgi:hypothetical protein
VIGPSGGTPAHGRDLQIILAAVCPAVQGADVRDALEGLTRQHGFALRRAEHRAQEESAGEDLHGDLQAYVHPLLHHDHLVVSANDRGVEPVVIIGANHGAHLVESANSVKIMREGLHHRVEALLTGFNGQAVPTPLIVDTGAGNVGCSPSRRCAISALRAGRIGSAGWQIGKSIGASRWPVARACAATAPRTARGPIRKRCRQWPFRAAAHRRPGTVIEDGNRRRAPFPD